MQKLYALNAQIFAKNFLNIFVMNKMPIKFGNNKNDLESIEFNISSFN